MKTKSAKNTLNPNDFVTVKLTDAGKLAIVRSIDAFNERIRTQYLTCTYRAKVPEWGVDGRITTQFHTLMEMLDGCWGPGTEMPFTELTKADK